MFILWLDRLDATWENLIRLLVDAEQKDLAEQVKVALNWLVECEVMDKKFACFANLILLSIFV